MRRRGLGIALLSAVMAVAVAATAARAALSPAQQREVLAEAQQAYDRGIATMPTDPAAARQSFREAAERFGLLVDEGVANGRLHYNLANALLQAGELGRAILHYRRAERLAPGDPRLEGNLQYARTLCRTRIEPAGRQALLDALLAWHHRTPLPRRVVAGSALYVAFWLILLIRHWRRTPAWTWAAVACGVLAAAAGASVAADWRAGDERAEGVILVDETIVRKGNGAGFAPQFEQPLHEGVEFQVRERRGEWIQIELADGKAGWIEAAKAGLI